MNTISRKFGVTTLAALLLGAILSFSSPSRAYGFGADQQDIGSAVRSKLNKSQYKNVQVNADANGIVTLSGTVDLAEYKDDADKTAHKVKGVAAVRNQIEVQGPSVPDAQLKKSLSEKLTYDRVGYGNLFDAVTLDVQNGVVTLGGHVHDYPNRDSYVATVSTTPGVKDVVDEIGVDPLSQMDDRTRIQVAQAIYGFPSLNRYAIDPAKPIRISVQNGNVELYGVVDSQADKDAAGIRANGVPGIFSVKNYLQVAGQGTEGQK
jgi:hyperosmotically inducible periplasmic protein